MATQQDYGLTFDQGAATILIAALDPALSEPQDSVHLGSC